MALGRKWKQWQTAPGSVIWNCANPAGNPNPPPAPAPQPIQPQLVEVRCLYEFRAVYDCDFNVKPHGIGNDFSVGANFTVDVPYPDRLGNSSQTSPYVNESIYKVNKPMSDIRFWCSVNTQGSYLGSTPAQQLATWNAIPRDTWLKCGSFSYCGGGDANKVQPMKIYHTSGVKEYWKDTSGCTNWYNYLHRWEKNQPGDNRELGFSIFKEVSNWINPNHYDPNHEEYVGHSYKCPDVPNPDDFPLGADGNAGSPPDIQAVAAQVGITGGCPQCYQAPICRFNNNLTWCGGAPNPSPYANAYTTMSEEPLHFCLPWAKKINLSKYPILRRLHHYQYNTPPHWLNWQRYTGGAYTSGKGSGMAWHCLVPAEVNATHMSQAAAKGTGQPGGIPGGMNPGNVPRIIPMEDLDSTFRGVRYWKKIKEEGKPLTFDNCKRCAYDYLIAYQPCGDNIIDPNDTSCVPGGAQSRVGNAVKNGNLIFRRVGPMRDPTVPAFFKALETQGWKNLSLVVKGTDKRCWIIHYIKAPTHVQLNYTFWAVKGLVGFNNGTRYAGVPLYAAHTDWLAIRGRYGPIFNNPTGVPGPIGNNVVADSHCFTPQAGLGGGTLDPPTCPCCHCNVGFASLPTEHHASVGSLDCGAKGPCCKTGAKNCVPNQEGAQCAVPPNAFYPNNLGAPPRTCGGVAPAKVTCPWGLCCDHSGVGAVRKTIELNPARGGGCQGFGHQYMGDGTTLADVCNDPDGCCCDKKLGISLGVMKQDICDKKNPGFPGVALGPMPRYAWNKMKGCPPGVGRADCRSYRSLHCGHINANTWVWDLQFETWAGRRTTTGPPRWTSGPGSGLRRTITAYVEEGDTGRTRNVFGGPPTYDAAGGSFRLNAVGPLNKWTGVFDMHSNRIVPARLVSGKFVKWRNIMASRCDRRLWMGKAPSKPEYIRNWYTRCGCQTKYKKGPVPGFRIWAHRCRTQEWNQSITGAGGVNNGCQSMTDGGDLDLWSDCYCGSNRNSQWKRGCNDCPPGSGRFIIL